jgi:DNA-binding transcriptional MerR regulator
VSSSLIEVESASSEPLYNIGVVSRITNLSMATLRAWERRYDFPTSERTAGGHRLYSEKDVLRLRWVKSRISEGMQTAQAIHALQHQEQTGQLILTETTPVEQTLSHYQPSLHLNIVLDKLLDSLINKDLTEADLILGDALAITSPDEIILDVISPAISKIGDAWEAGKINISTEHLATNYLRQRLLMWMLSGPPTRVMNPILMACGPDEWHEGSLLVLGSLLRRRRWPVAYLGQSVPLDDLAEFVRSVKPSLLILVAMTEKSGEKLIEWPKFMPEVEESGRPIVGYGGRIFSLHPEWRLKMKGLFLGNSFKEGLETIERLL